LTNVLQLCAAFVLFPFQNNLTSGICQMEKRTSYI